MSFKNALTKMGLIEEAAAQKAKAPQPVPTSMPRQDFQSTSNWSTPTVTAPVNADVTTIKATLLQSIQDSKLAGFDYLKFISAVEEMKGTGGKEDACFKMAFMAAKQLGVDKDALAKSGQHYLDVLHQDESDFNSDCDNFEKQELGGREAKIAELNAKIASLTQELAQAQQDFSSLSSELKTKHDSLESRKISFQSALKAVSSAIEYNIQKINQYL